MHAVSHAIWINTTDMHAFSRCLATIQELIIVQPRKSIISWWCVLKLLHSNNLVKGHLGLED